MNGARILLIATILAALSCLGQAQVVPGSPKFDVASVKPVEFQRFAGRPCHLDAVRFDCHMIPVSALVLQAWGVVGYQVVWPKWMSGNNSYWDVAATMPAGATPQQLPAMLQALLTDRFKISVHRETRDVPVYALEISARGLKMHPAEHPPADETGSGFTSAVTGESWHLTSKRPNQPASAPSGVSMSNLVSFAGLKADRPMVDQTGLKGFYEMDMVVPREPENSPWSDVVFFDAMEKQLGLQVVKKTLPTEMLIIDHLEQTPTEN